MRKEKLLSLITISGIALLGSTSVFASDMTDTLIDNQPVVVMTSLSDSVSDTTDTSVPTPSPSNPVSDTTDTSIPIPIPSDPVSGTTDSSVPIPKTDDSSTPTSDDTNTEKPVDKPSENIPTDSSKPVPIQEEPVKPVTKPIIDDPITTATGARIVGTQDGKVLVQTETGTQVKEAKEVGGEVQKDGTVAIKKADGKVEVLPHTGDSKKVFTALGIILILVAFWVGFKENIKKFLTMFSKKRKQE
ncbi:TPA: LPXTG cell wall anchor domain-containing protein [Streptococcus agalactiae]|nr:LPXTG cell wall anchor domain-containing protein [Streptococcus agalactiae]HEN0994294.1 LPXTG cell wall anchor domain-containing protein [Streptococcus agalactiae]